MINFEDFQKLDLRVAKIIKAEKVTGSDKLLRLEIDLGREKRQIVAGLGQFYQPDDLVDREIVVIVNLEPRKIFSLESEGMLLAADDDGRPILLGPDQEVPAGTRIR